MRDSAPHRLTERRQAILRQASAALRGRPVTLWRMANGGAVAELVSQPTPPRDAGLARTCSPTSRSSPTRLKGR